MRRLAILSLMFFLLIPSIAQDGQGIVREGIASDFDEDMGSFNPLRCNQQTCSWVIDRIFPNLLAIDPISHWYTNGTSENGGLAESWEISADNLIYTFHLRDDAFWNDGTPISSYDYLYSYLAITSEDFASPYWGLDDTIEGLVPLSEKDFAVILRENNCDVLPNLNFPLAPAHAFDTEFANEASTFFTEEGDIREEWAEWKESFVSDFDFMIGHPFDDFPSVTAGEFEFVSWQPKTYIRLQSGDLAYELVPIPNWDEEVNLFLNGELSFVNYPLDNRLGDILAAEDIQVYQAPNNAWDYLAFNLADPSDPQSAFDEDGNAIEQSPSPYFADIRVRQAIQLAINVPELIESGLQGQGQPIAAFQTPLSWAYNENLPLSSYDPDAARDLLEEAAWVQIGNSAVRSCLHCNTASDGVSLYLSLEYQDTPQLRIIASLIEQELEAVGIGVDSYASDFTYMTNQSFHLYLGTWGDAYPNANSTNDFFLPEADQLFAGMNISSYNNPEVTRLLESARTLSGCGLAERRDLIQEAESLIQADQPFVWLYAHHQTLVVTGAVQNFEPIIGNPLGNLADWLIFELPN